MGDWEAQARARKETGDKLREEIAKKCMDDFYLHSTGAALFKGFFDFTMLNDRGCVEAEFVVTETDSKSGKLKNTWTITVNADLADNRRGSHYGYSIMWAGSSHQAGRTRVIGHVDLPPGVVLKYNRGERPSEFDINKACEQHGFGTGDRPKSTNPPHPTIFYVGATGYFLKGK